MAYMLLLPFCVEPILKITSSVQGIHSIASNISLYASNPDVTHALKEMDIGVTVQMIEKIIENLDMKYRGLSIVNNIINEIEICIDNINDELGKIYAKLSYNKSLYRIMSFKKYTFTDNIETLQKLRTQLDNRYKMFTSLLKVHQYLACDTTTEEYKAAQEQAHAMIERSKNREIVNGDFTIINKRH